MTQVAHAGRPFRRGWVLKDDKLLMFEDRRVLVLRGWPDPRAWTRTLGQPWRGCRPTEPLLWSIGVAARDRFVQRSMRAIAKRRAVGEVTGEELARIRAGLTARSLAARTFLEGFPNPVLSLASALPERHWHMLALLARVAGASDIAEDNPALAHAMASSWAFRTRRDEHPYRTAERMLRRRRVEIAEWLGFPARPAVVRVLGKVRPRAVTVRRLRYLRETLRAEPMPKALLHLPSLDRGVLRIITDRRLLSHVTYSLLEGVAADPMEQGVERMAYMLDDSLRMAGELEERLAPLRSIGELCSVHDELTEKLNARDNDELASVVLPPPPLAGSDDIVPLACAQELIDEGREMNHCVASYVHLVAAGRVYVYRLLAPERATISLRADRDGWELEQIKGPSNAPVELETEQRVREWLASMRQVTSEARRSSGMWQQDLFEPWEQRA